MKKGNRLKATGNSQRAKTIGVAGFALCALLCALCDFAEAQQPEKVPRIGIVRGDRNAPAPSIKIFQQACRISVTLKERISSLSIATPREVKTKRQKLWPNL